MSQRSQVRCLRWEAQFGMPMNSPEWRVPILQIVIIMHQQCFNRLSIPFSSCSNDWLTHDLMINLIEASIPKSRSWESHFDSKLEQIGYQTWVANHQPNHTKAMHYVIVHLANFGVDSSWFNWWYMADRFEPLSSSLDSVFGLSGITLSANRPPCFCDFDT